MKKSNNTSVAMKLIVTLLSVSAISPAISSESTQGNGNLVTGEKGVADGYNNTVTATKGTAQGNDSVATGNNLSRSEFTTKLSEHNSLLADKATKENEINTTNTNIKVNQQTQSDLAKAINDLTQKINSSNQKSQQLDDLNGQLTPKQSELEKLQAALEQARQNATTQSATGKGDKTLWTDFTAQLGKLDWTKLTDNSNGTSGVNKVATQLKGMIETDFPEMTVKDVADYETVINGYINRQGFYDVNKRKLDTSYASNANYLGFLFDIAGPSEVGNILTKGMTEYLTRTNKVNSLDIKLDNVSNLSKESYKKAYSGNSGAMYSFYNLKNIINSENYNEVQNIAKSYMAIYYNSSWRNSAYNNMDKGISLFELPPVQQGKIASTAFIHQRNLAYFLKDRFRNELSRGSVTSEDISYLKGYISLFYDNFYNKIDFNADENKWLFDSNSFKTQLAKVENFVSLIRDYTTTYDTAMANPNDAQAQVDLITKYNQIREMKDDSTNYYENINFQIKDSVKKLWNTFAKQTATELTEDAKRLKMYDANNGIIKGVINVAQGLDDDIATKEQAVKAKQAEIDAINQQISNLALTPDEQAADELKTQKEQELAKKQVEKTQLEQDKAAKEAELAEIIKQLNETTLANLGKNSTAIGTNAFASGNDSIAIGTNATAQHQNVVAIGHNAVVTAANSVAIGANNTVSAANTFVLGTNINADAANSVVLGANSTVAQAFGTDKITIQNQEYTFAGNTPVGTVSVGSADGERTITNVAAGRVSAESTDVINGSQLNAVIKALNNLQIESNVKTTADTAKSTADGAANLAQIAKATADKAHTRINDLDTKTVQYNTDGDLVTLHSNNGKGTKIANVKNGNVSANSLDAVNGSQLHTVKTIADTAVAKADANTKSINTNRTRIEQLEQSSIATNQRVDRVDRKIHENRKRSDAGIAAASAIAIIPQVTNPSETGVGVGTATKNGQSAIAIGASKSSDNGKHIIKLATSYDSQHNFIGAAGYMYKW